MNMKKAIYQFTCLFFVITLILEGYSTVNARSSRLTYAVQSVNALSSDQNLTPISYTTMSGSTSGQPVKAMAVNDQSGKDNNAEAYVLFTTPGVVYEGIQVFTLYTNNKKTALKTMLLNINFMATASSGQQWSWFIYNWANQDWTLLGTSINATANTWTMLTFAAANPYQFVDASGEIRVRLLSSDASGDAKIDYEAIYLTYQSAATSTSLPPTPTATSVSSTPTPTATRVRSTPTPTTTSLPPTPTPTATSVSSTPTPTATSVRSTPTPTKTSVPPTPTPTKSSVPSTPTPTKTSVPSTPTPTATRVPPTPTRTATSVPSTPTPTATSIFLIPTPTATSVPPTPPPASMTYYVSPTGNDSNPGTQSQPWGTIQKAADTMVAGDTVNVNAGNYGGNSSVYKKVRIIKGGSAGQQITYQAIGTVFTQGFIVSANYITIDGFDIEDPHDGRVKNSTEPDYRGGTGIFVEGSYNIIEDNYIHGCVWSGIKLSKSGNFLLPSNVIVRNNRLFRNGMSGIEVAGRNNLIEGNEIWATIQHHPGNILSATVTWLDADGMRFFGQGHIIRKNYIHDIKYGAPGVNLDPNDPNNIYNMLNDYNDNPHIDCFQTWTGTSNEMAQNIIFEQNYCENLQSQAQNENGHGFMLSGGANNLTIRNNIIVAYTGVNTGGSGNAHHLYIYNNLWINNLTFHQFWPNAIGLDNAPYSIVNNNIFYNQPYHTITVTGDTTGQSIDYNQAFNSDGSNADCMRVGNYVCANPPPAHDKWNIDPLFTNPAISDYHPQANSPVIDAGVAVPITNDYDGNPRPNGGGFEIGAYEF